MQFPQRSQPFPFLKPLSSFFLPFPALDQTLSSPNRETLHRKAVPVFQKQIHKEKAITKTETQKKKKKQKRQREG